MRVFTQKFFITTAALQSSVKPNTGVFRELTKVALQIYIKERKAGFFRVIGNYAVVSMHVSVPYPVQVKTHFSLKANATPI